MTDQEFWDGILIKDFRQKDRLEAKINGSWHAVTGYIFRSWAGPRRINGTDYSGKVYYLGSNLVARNGS